MSNLDDGKTPFLTDDDVDFDQADFASMVEQSLTGIKEGEVVTGHVIEITPVGVIVDIGYKAEGEIPIDEFEDEDERNSISPGDEIQVLIESYHHDGEEEVLILSRRRAGEASAWEAIETAYRDDGTITGAIVGRVKGGLRVDIGVPAFLPGSQVDLRPVRDMDSLLGQSFEFKVIKYSRRRRNVVLSRRVILEQNREKDKTKLMSNLADGQVVKGIVKNVVKYGAFIDLGGMDGLLHVSDMSWGRINHPSDVVSVGQELEIKILKFDQAKERISLGLKQLTPDPWETAVSNYEVGSLVSGKVVNVVDYGAFVEMQPGLEGLIHVTELSWSNNVRQASAVLSEGEEIEAMVINIDAENRKLALSLKQTMPDPWEGVEDRFPLGAVIEATIKTITDFGVFIGLEEGVDGLIHRRDLTWKANPANPEDTYKSGDKIKAMVINIDMDKKRVALGIKQLTENPWHELTKDISVGGVMSGTVSDQTEIGTFVSLAKELDGLIPAVEDDDSAVSLEEGSEVEVRVLECDPDRQRLTLALIPPSSIDG